MTDAEFHSLFPMYTQWLESLAVRLADGDTTIGIVLDSLEKRDAEWVVALAKDIQRRRIANRLLPVLKDIAEWIGVVLIVAVVLFGIALFCVTPL